MVETITPAVCGGRHRKQVAVALFAVGAIAAAAALGAALGAIGSHARPGRRPRRRGRPRAARGAARGRLAAPAAPAARAAGAGAGAPRVAAPRLEPGLRRRPGLRVPDPPGGRDVLDRRRPARSPWATRSSPPCVPGPVRPGPRADGGAARPRPPRPRRRRRAPRPPPPGAAPRERDHAGRPRGRHRRHPGAGAGRRQRQVRPRRLGSASSPPPSRPPAARPPWSCGRGCSPPVRFEGGTSPALDGDLLAYADAAGIRVVQLAHRPGDAAPRPPPRDPHQAGPRLAPRRLRPRVSRAASAWSCSTRRTAAPAATRRTLGATDLGRPALRNGVIAWHVAAGRHSEIRVARVARRGYRVLATSVTGLQINPSIAAGRILWVEQAGSFSYLHIRRLAGGRVRTLATLRGPSRFLWTTALASRTAYATRWNPINGRARADRAPLALSAAASAASADQLDRRCSCSSSGTSVGLRVLARPLGRVHVLERVEDRHVQLVEEVDLVGRDVAPVVVRSSAPSAG